MMRRQILIVDDDPCVGDLLEELLTKEGYGALRAYSGTEALLLMEKARPDLVLLDRMLPGMQGDEVLRRMPKVPVIVLSARDEVEGKVNLLLDGAADYVTKPFDSRELLARIAVQLRAPSREGLAPVIEAGRLRLNEAGREAEFDGRALRLTRTEYAILKLLMQNPGRAIAKSVILEHISLDTPDCTDSSLKQHVSNLRRKLREAGCGDCIEAVWGVGFRLVVP